MIGTAPIELFGTCITSENPPSVSAVLDAVALPKTREMGSNASNPVPVSMTMLPAGPLVDASDTDAVVVAGAVDDVVLVAALVVVPLEELALDGVVPIVVVAAVLVATCASTTVPTNTNRSNKPSNTNAFRISGFRLAFIQESMRSHF